MKTETPLTDEAWEAMIQHPLENVGVELRDLCRQLESENCKLRELVKEVTQWHSIPDSGDYNYCDTSPCHWCEMANDILSNVPDEVSLPASGRGDAASQTKKSTK
jgi:hypothetical protein